MSSPSYVSDTVPECPGNLCIRLIFVDWKGDVLPVTASCTALDSSNHEHTGTIANGIMHLGCLPSGEVAITVPDKDKEKWQEALKKHNVENLCTQEYASWLTGERYTSLAEKCQQEADGLLQTLNNVSNAVNRPVKKLFEAYVDAYTWVLEKMTPLPDDSFPDAKDVFQAVKNRLESWFYSPEDLEYSLDNFLEQGCTVQATPCQGGQTCDTAIRVVLEILPALSGCKYNDRHPYCAKTPRPIPPGDCDYYQKRHDDFLCRHQVQGCCPPDYYLGYGKKYCERFTQETMEKLSPQGKKWLEKTKYWLQRFIEQGFKDGITLGGYEESLSEPAFYESQEVCCQELNGEAFKELMFIMHPDAYFKAGLAKVTRGDLYEIGTTPDNLDLLEGSPEGAKVGVEWVTNEAKEMGKQLKEIIRSKF